MQKEIFPDIYEFTNILKKTFEYNNLTEFTSEIIINKFYKLTQYLITKNKEINLTAITDISEIVSKHYADCCLYQNLFPYNSTVLDVGAGAGFPTLPLSIIRPDLKITALDSTNKRIEFINSVTKILNLNNVKTLTDRAESLGRKTEFRNSFDIVCARAVAGMNMLSELCIPLVKVNGLFISLRGSDADNQISESQNIIKELYGEIIEKKSLELYSKDNISLGTRTAVCILKKQITPEKFPRKYSLIKKHQI